MRKIFIWTASALLLLLVLAVSVLILVQTGPGRTGLENTLNKILDTDRFSIQISRLGGTIPFDMTIGSIIISDVHGPWLKIEDISLDWSFSALFSNQLHISELGADLVDLKQEPAFKFPGNKKNRKDLQDLTWSWPLPSLNLKNLYINRIRVAPEVMDQEINLGFKASAFADSTGFSLKGQARRLDSPETMLSLDAGFSSQSTALDLNLMLNDQGFIKKITRIRNLPRDISLNLQGRGPLDSWKGGLDIQGRDMLKASMNIGLQETETYKLQTTGNLYVDPALLPAGGFNLTSQAFDLSMEAGPGKGSLLQINSLALTSPRLDLLARADFNPRTTDLSGEVQLHLPDMNPLFMNSGFSSPDPLNFQAEFQGTVNDLSLDTTLETGRIKGHGLNWDQALFQAGINTSIQKPVPASVQGSLNFSGLALRHYKPVPSQGKISFRADCTSEYLLRLNSLDIQTPRLKAAGSGQINLSKLVFSGNLELSARQAQSFIPVTNIAKLMSSNLDLEFQGQGDIKKGTYQAGLKSRFYQFESPDPLISSSMGSSPQLEAKLSFDQSLTLNISHARLHAARLDFQAGGDLNFREKSMDLKGQVQAPSLAYLQKEPGLDISGELVSEITARGSLQKPETLVKTRLHHLQWAGLAPLQVSADMRTIFRQGLPRGDIRILLRQKNQKLRLSSGFKLHQKILSLNSLQGNGPGFNLSGYLDLNDRFSPAGGDISLSLHNLKTLGGFLGLDVAGNIQSSLQLRPDEQGQNAHIQLRGQDVVHKNIRISSLRGQTHIDHIFHQPEFHLDLSLSKTSLSDAVIDQLNLQARGNPGKTVFEAGFAGHAGLPFDLNLDGEYLASGSSKELRLNSLAGNMARETVRLTSPAVLNHAPGKILLHPVHLYFASAGLKARGTLTREEVKASLDLEGLRTTDIPLPGLEHVLGQIDLDLDLSGPPARPVIQASFLAGGLAPADASLDCPAGIDLSGHLGLENQKLSLKARITEDSRDMASLDLSLPLGLSLNPWDLDLPDPLPVQGRFRADLPLKKISMIFMPADQSLTGELLADLGIDGELPSPALTGTLQLENGTYEHVEAGIYISALELLARARGDSLELSSLEASDGLEGAMSGSGRISLDPADRLSWLLNLKARNTRLLNHKLASIDMDQAQLQLQGNLDQAEIQGQVQFAEVQGTLPEHAPAEIVHLKVREINGPEIQTVPQKTQHRTNYPVHLDVELNFPGQAFVRGRGLDSEWQGGLQVNGQASRPRLRGQLQVVRGRLMLLDRRFDLTPDSAIILDGSYPPEPVVDIRAALQQKDMLINVGVHGPATDPEIQLSSEPLMPEDEILARILFGRDISTLTPFQAAALLNAGRKLATGDSGPGLLDSVRNFMGVDDIDISRDDQGHAQFGLGKYIHEKVYVEVKKGTGSGSDEVEVEMELSPKISLESSVESKSEGGIGIFWKHDY
ncbi:MAG: translocation/assembly module TamB domain-containing protein [Desulfonatronovibrionaceae bacterium]